jgi:hypothetical protein
MKMLFGIGIGAIAVLWLGAHHRRMQALEQKAQAQHRNRLAYLMARNPNMN